MVVLLVSGRCTEAERTIGDVTDAFESDRIIAQLSKGVIGTSTLELSGGGTRGAGCTSNASGVGAGDLLEEIRSRGRKLEQLVILVLDDGGHSEKPSFHDKHEVEVEL